MTAKPPVKNALLLETKAKRNKLEGTTVQFDFPILHRYGLSPLFEQIRVPGALHRQGKLQPDSAIRSHCLVTTKNKLVALLSFLERSYFKVSLDRHKTVRRRQAAVVLVGRHHPERAVEAMRLIDKFAWRSMLRHEDKYCIQTCGFRPRTRRVHCNRDSL